MADSASGTPQARGHEVADVSGRRIAWVAVGLVASLLVVALAALGAHWLLRPDGGTDQAPAHPVAQSANPPAHRLQTAPTLDLKTLRQQKAAMLNQYRWIDQGKDVVQIPIERAMQLMVERSAGKHPENKKQAEPPQ